MLGQLIKEIVELIFKRNLIYNNLVNRDKQLSCNKFMKFLFCNLLVLLFVSLIHTSGLATGTALSSPNISIAQSLILNANSIAGGETNRIFLVITERSQYNNNTFMFYNLSSPNPPILDILEFTSINATTITLNIPPMKVYTQGNLTYHYLISRGNFWKIVGIKNRILYDFPTWDQPLDITIIESSSLDMSALPGNAQDYTTMIASRLLYNNRPESYFCNFQVTFVGVLRALYFNGVNVLTSASITSSSFRTVSAFDTVVFPGQKVIMLTFIGYMLNVSSYSFTNCQYTNSSRPVTPSYTTLGIWDTIDHDNVVISSHLQSCTKSNCIQCYEKYPESVVCLKCASGYYLYQSSCIAMCNQGSSYYYYTVNDYCHSAVINRGFRCATTTCTNTSFGFNLHVDSMGDDVILAHYTVRNPIFGNHSATFF